MLFTHLLWEYFFYLTIIFDSSYFNLHYMILYCRSLQLWHGQLAWIDSRSFWSKICLLLAAVHLIWLLVEYYNKLYNTRKEIKVQFQIYTNFLTMFKNVEQWYVIWGIHDALKWFPTKPTLGICIATKMKHLLPKNYPYQHSWI